ncbi:hypothetical protein RIdsm_05407 (plasmid) [Roseovarius indicus]|nr:hypothetical protein RIdsm_05407 [Roseovarius indicus]SFE47568.1 hypothetical protein SAMN04488031_110175 [Roseovarius indicus]
MPPKPQSRAVRAEALVATMPNVPCDVADRLRQAALVKDLAPRGMPAALERFFSRLAAEGRAPEFAQAEDFAASTQSRTAFRTLLAALSRFAPDVPTAAAVPVKRDWDAWLNGRYNTRAPRPRRSRREALRPEEWPEAWRAALPCLARRARRDGRRYRPLGSKSRGSVVQAVGLLALARENAIAEGSEFGDGFTPELAEAFLGFLVERVNPRSGEPIRFGTIADYFERVMCLAARAELYAPDGEASFGEILAACRAEAAEETPMKRARMREFREKHGLDGVLLAAVAASEEARDLPGHSDRAARLRRKAVVFALLVNGVDRQGDLSEFRIGRDIVRRADGTWEPAFRQSKTARWKENGPLWGLTGLLIDAHVLEGRPAWCIETRIAELDGCNLLSLQAEGFDTYHASKLLREAFGISGHLIRTAVTDLLRRHRPDAAWAVQRLLGHSVEWMQENYRSEFAEVASVEKYHAALEMLVRGETSPASAPRRRKRG